MLNKNTSTYTRQIVHSIKHYHYSNAEHNLRQYAEKLKFREKYNVGLLFLIYTRAAQNNS